MPSDRRTPVVVVTGWGTDSESLAQMLLTKDTVLVCHRLNQLSEGVVIRTIRTSRDVRTEVLELAHGCVSCTLREDLLPLLRRLAVRSNVGRIVLALDPLLEPEVVCWAIEHVVITGVVGQLDGPAARDVRIAGVIAGVDSAWWLADATGDETVADRGYLPGTGDERTVAQIVVGQVEFADALIVTGDPDPFARARLDAVMRRLNPGAVQLWVTRAEDANLQQLLDRLPASARRGEIDDAHAPLLRGEPPLNIELGVGLIEFSADRPFHPARLHDAIDVLLTGVLRVRGRLWVGTQPDRVLRIESAGGGLRVGDGGAWLAAMTPAQRDCVPPIRRAMAALRWHPRFGDRDVSIVVLVHDANPSEIERTLRWALVTDDELNAEHKWASWFDPFGSWHEDPCDSVESPHAKSNSSHSNSPRKDQA